MILQGGEDEIRSEEKRNGDLLAAKINEDKNNSGNKSNNKKEDEKASEAEI